MSWPSPSARLPALYRPATSVPRTQITRSTGGPRPGFRLFKLTSCYRWLFPGQLTSCRPARSWAECRRIQFAKSLTHLVNKLLAMLLRLLVSPSSGIIIHFYVIMYLPKDLGNAKGRLVSRNAYCVQDFSFHFFLFLFLVYNNPRGRRRVFFLSKLSWNRQRIKASCCPYPCPAAWIMGATCEPVSPL